ncbi:hypothetical protein CsSME_00025229 [Camellia sinensis var. sinensis]
MGGEERWCVVTGGRGFAARHLVEMLIRYDMVLTLPRRRESLAKLYSQVMLNTYRLIFGTSPKYLKLAKELRLFSIWLPRIHPLTTTNSIIPLMSKVKMKLVLVLTSKLSDLYIPALLVLSLMEFME